MNLYYSNGVIIPPFLKYVESFGAVGDGITDDTTAIQAALDAANSGGKIVFGGGIYKITEPLFVYSNQVIDLNGSTILQGANINNLMRGWCKKSANLYNGPHDIIIENGTFDGGNFTINNTLLGFCHSKNITIRKCVFKNAYGAWHNIEINSSKHVLIEDCTFEGSRKFVNGCLIQIDSYDNTSTWPWQDGLTDHTIAYMIEIAGCHFYNSVYAPAIGNHSSGNAGDYIKIHDCTFESFTGSRGAINFQSGNHIDCYNNTFTNCEICMKIDSVGTNTFNNNRVDNSTQICNGDIIEFANIIDGINIDKTTLDNVAEDYAAALVALGVNNS